MGNCKLQGSRVRRKGKQIEELASILPKLTPELPTITVSPVTRWKHLSNLELDDPDNGIPAQVDILLKGKFFIKAPLHGQ